MQDQVKVEEMDGKMAMDHLDELEFAARQLENDPSQEGQEERKKIGELIDRVKNHLAQCLKRRQDANYRRLRRSNLTKIWRLKKLVEACPSFVLHEPEDFLLYWYVHGEFPCGMSLRDVEQTRQELLSKRNRLTCQEGSDAAYVAYRREKIKAQLQQLRDATETLFRGAFQNKDKENTETSVDRQDGEPICLFVIPEEPEHPEDMTIPELAWEIEKQEYNLFELKSVENGEEGTERPIFWQESADYAKALLSRLRGLLRQRLLEALGVETEDPSVPAEFQDGDLPIFCGGDELERPEDIVASWYLSDSFPLITSCEKMQQVEAELKRQQSQLEAAEPEDEAEHTVWQFCMEQRAEQLEQIQTMMRNQETDWEFVDLEEEPAEEW